MAGILAGLRFVIDNPPELHDAMRAYALEIVTNAKSTLSGACFQQHTSRLEHASFTVAVSGFG